jgi:hypothetical protein
LLLAAQVCAICVRGRTALTIEGSRNDGADTMEWVQRQVQFFCAKYATHRQSTFTSQQRHAPLMTSPSRRNGATDRCFRCVEARFGGWWGGEGSVDSAMELSRMECGSLWTERDGIQVGASADGILSTLDLKRPQTAMFGQWLLITTAFPYATLFHVSFCPPPPPFPPLPPPSPAVSSATKVSRLTLLCRTIRHCAMRCLMTGCRLSSRGGRSCPR